MEQIVKRELERIDNEIANCDNSLAIILLLAKKQELILAFNNFSK